jgi:hypothetical protein
VADVARQIEMVRASGASKNVDDWVSACRSVGVTGI